jgi:protein-S-isoprenylcysteine O-methyltransferase Ste14
VLPGSVARVADAALPFWHRGKVVALQTAVALALAVAAAVLVPHSAGFVAAGFLVLSAALRVLSWQVRRRERQNSSANRLPARRGS